MNGDLYYNDRNNLSVDTSSYINNVVTIRVSVAIALTDRVTFINAERRRERKHWVILVYGQDSKSLLCF